jgi:hypothetical protein
MPDHAAHPSGLRNENGRGVAIPRTKTGWRHRLARELVPGLIGIGALAIVTISASQSALGVVLTPVHNSASACSSHSPQAAFDCTVDAAAGQAPKGPADDN